MNSPTHRKPKNPRQQAAQSIVWPWLETSNEWQINYIRLLVMGWRFGWFEPWWRLIPRSTHCRWRQPTRQALVDVKWSNCLKVNLDGQVVKGICEMGAETYECFFAGWMHWSAWREMIVLSAKSLEAMLGCRTNFPSRRSKTTTQVEMSFICQSRSKSSRNCCGIWVWSGFAWGASCRKHCHWKGNNGSAMGLHFPLTEEAGKEKSDVLLEGRDNELSVLGPWW